MTETLKNNSENEKTGSDYDRLSDMAGQFNKAQAEQEKAKQKEELAKKQTEEKPFNPDSISPREAVGALYRTQRDPKDIKPVETWEDFDKKLWPNPVVRKYKNIKHQLSKRKNK